MYQDKSEQGSLLLPAFFVLSICLHILPIWLFRDTVLKGREEYLELSLDQVYEQPSIDVPQPAYQETKPPELMEILPTTIRRIQPELLKPKNPSHLQQDIALPDVSDLIPPKITPYEPLSAASKPQDSLNEGVNKAYFQAVRTKINKNKRYPEQARKKRTKGNVRVRFTLHRNGSVSEIFAASNNNLKILEQAAVEAVRSSSPFPPFPESMEKDVVTVSVRIRFSLSRR